LSATATHYAADNHDVRAFDIFIIQFHIGSEVKSNYKWCQEKIFRFSNLLL